MDISCPQCQTVYEVEELNAYSPAISLQCSECNFVFRLRAPGRSIEENQRRWMIRSSAQGDILYFNTFDVLHRWIMEGHVSGDDAISRTGERWTNLKEIGEFAPIFQTVESIAKIADTRAGQSGQVGQFSGGHASQSKPAANPAAAVLASESEEIVTKVIPSPPFQAPPFQAPPFQPPPRAQQAAVTPAASNEGFKSHTLPFGIAAEARNAAPPVRNNQTLSGLTHAPRPTTSPAPAVAQTQAQSPSAQSPSAQSPSAQQHAVSRAPALDYPALPANQEDDWSFGDATPAVEFREPAHQEATKTWVVHAIHETPPRSRHRRTITIVAAICIITGLGAAAFFTLEPLQPLRNSVFSTRDVISLGDPAAVEQSTENAPESPGNLVEQPQVNAALNASHAMSLQQIHRALASASEQQKQQHQQAQAKAARTPEKPEKVADVQKKPSENNDLQSVLERARLALERGKPAQARQLYHQAARLDAQNAEAIAGLGWSLLAMGNADSARAQFRRAKYRDPSFDGSYIGLGRAERDLGNFEEALAAYEDYLKRFPDGPQISIARYQSEELKRHLGR